MDKADYDDNKEYSWKEEIPKLKLSCHKIENLLGEATEDGSLMVSQLMFLGDLIREFLNNPIVKYSGIERGIQK